MKKLTRKQQDMIEYLQAAAVRWRERADRHYEAAAELKGSLYTAHPEDVAKLAFEHEQALKLGDQAMLFSAAMLEEADILAQSQGTAT